MKFWVVVECEGDPPHSSTVSLRTSDRDAVMFVTATTVTVDPAHIVSETMGL